MSAKKQLKDLRLGDCLYSIDVKIENEELVYFIQETKITELKFVYSKNGEVVIINNFLPQLLSSTSLVYENYTNHSNMYCTTKEEIINKLEQMLNKK